MTTFINNDVASGDIVKASDHNTQGALLAAVINGNIDSGNMASNAVSTSKIASNAVTRDKIDFSSFVSSSNDSYIFTDESTTSTTFADLATVGPQVTVTIGSNGCALVFISGGIYGSTTANKYIGVQVSGANTIAASTNQEKGLRSATQTFVLNQGRTMFFSGLNSGSTTFTMKYLTQSGTGNFFGRRLTVLPL